MRLALCTRVDHLVQGSNIGSWSISWNTPRPFDASGLAPPKAMIGVQSAQACATPVTRLVVAGPDAAMQMPGLFSSRA